MVLAGVIGERMLDTKGERGREGKWPDCPGVTFTPRPCPGLRWEWSLPQTPGQTGQTDTQTQCLMKVFSSLCF